MASHARPQTDRPARSQSAPGWHWRSRIGLIARVSFGLLLTLGLLWLSVWEEETHLLWRTNSGFLARYDLLLGPLQLPAEASQSSGLAYVPDRGALYVVVNQPPAIIELDPRLRPLRTVRLEGFADTEGIAYLGDGRFAVVDERRGVLSRFRLGASGVAVDYATAEHLQVIAPEAMVRNRGLEGVAYVPGTDRYLVIEERLPRRIFEVHWPDPGQGPVSVTEPWDAEALPWWGLRNLSDVYYDPRTGCLLILSRRSKAVVAYTPTGVEVARLHLTAGSAGLEHAIIAAEGLTMGADGNLYVCAEHGLLYVFAPSNRPVSVPAQ